MIHVAAAVPVALGAKKGVEPIVKELKELLTGDIVTIEGEMFREVTAKFKGGKKSTRLVPVKYMFRINALSILLAVGGVGLTVMLIGFGLWWSQLRLGRMGESQRNRNTNIVVNVDKLLLTIEALERQLKRGEPMERGLLSSVLSQSNFHRPSLDFPLLPITPFADADAAYLVRVKKHLLKVKAAAKRRLKVGLQITERKGFRFGPEEISLFG